MGHGQVPIPAAWCLVQTTVLTLGSMPTTDRTCASGISNGTTPLLVEGEWPKGHPKPEGVGVPREHTPRKPVSQKPLHRPPGVVMDKTKPPPKHHLVVARGGHDWFRV